MPINKEYQKLKKLWYKKLAKSGFRDVEQDEDNLKLWSSRFARVPVLLGRQDYYIMATNFLTDYEFQSKIDEAIWAYHTEGISYRNIAKLLKKARVRKTGIVKICNKVQALQKAMYEMYGVK